MKADTSLFSISEMVILFTIKYAHYIKDGEFIYS